MQQRSFLKVVGGIVFAAMLLSCVLSKAEEVSRKSGPDGGDQQKDVIFLSNSSLSSHSNGPGNIPKQMNALEFAKMVMEDYRGKFDFIKTLIVWASAVIVFLIGGFGIGGLVQISNIRKELRAEHDIRLQKLESHLATITEEKEKLEVLTGGLSRTLQSLSYVMNALDLIRYDDRTKLRRAQRYIDKVLEKLKPDLVELIRSSYTIRGFIQKRLVGPRLALESVEAVINYDEDGHIYYNAACYAALDGQQEKWPHFLNESIIRDPGYLELALRDPDFEGVRATEEFKEVTRRD